MQKRNDKIGWLGIGSISPYILLPSALYVCTVIHTRACQKNENVFMLTSLCLFVEKPYAADPAGKAPQACECVVYTSTRVDYGKITRKAFFPHSKRKAFAAVGRGGECPPYIRIFILEVCIYFEVLHVHMFVTPDLTYKNGGGWRSTV